MSQEFKNIFEIAPSSRDRPGESQRKPSLPSLFSTIFLFSANYSFSVIYYSTPPGASQNSRDPSHFLFGPEVYHPNLQRLKIDHGQQPRLRHQSHTLLIISLPLPSPTVHDRRPPIHPRPGHVDMARGEHVRNTLHYQ